MNASFLNPFNVTYPTAVQTSLNGSGTLVARFNPSGQYIAGGTWNGAAVIWELDTCSIVRVLEGHAKKKAVTSVSWSRNSRYLLTAGKDWNIVIWDLSLHSDLLDRRNTIRFDQAILSASFHPRNSKIILAVLSSGEAFLIDQRESPHSRTELCEVLDEEDEQGPRRHAALRSEHIPIPQKSPRVGITAAIFDPTGKHVFAGTSAGSLIVFNTRTAMIVGRHKISGATSMKQLVLTKNGRWMLTNSTDRTLRQFVVPAYPNPAEGVIMEEDLEPIARFSDPINRIAWNGMAFSPDAEWAAGGAADPAVHKIYIWDLSAGGQFAADLDGGREVLSDIDWHPTGPWIASTTKVGDIILWHCPTPERWGAFAGGFEELDENVEYAEREDEFDIEDESVVQRRKAEQEEEEVNVDEPWSEQKVLASRVEEDEDTRWADEQPDDDTDPQWRLPVIMEADE